MGLNQEKNTGGKSSYTIPLRFADQVHFWLWVLFSQCAFSFFSEGPSLIALLKYLAIKRYKNGLFAFLIQIQLNTNPKHCIKGTVQRDFRPPVFFIIPTGLGHWPMGENVFKFRFVFAEIFKFLRSSARYHTAQSQAQCSIILRGVKFRAVSSSVQYDTAQSQVTFQYPF